MPNLKGMPKLEGWPKLEGQPELERVPGLGRVARIGALHAYPRYKPRAVPLDYMNGYQEYKTIYLLSMVAKQPYNMPYAAKAKTQQFTRRKSNLVKKADQLARLCHADLALIIRKN